jgi:hypothetical protein
MNSFFFETRKEEITASDVKKKENKHNTEQVENTICTYEWERKQSLTYTK